MSNVAGLSPAVDRLLDESSSGSSNPVSPATESRTTASKSHF